MNLNTINHRAFTLVELLVVISIIGLLSTIATVSLSSARIKSRDTKRIADLRQIRLALSLYYNDNGYYPPSGCGYDCNGYYMSNSAAGWNTLAAALAPYLATLPKDPINSPSGVPWDTATASYEYGYGNVGRYTYPNTYDLFARLEDPNSPERCGVKKWKFAKGIGAEMDWCGGYSVQLYEMPPSD